MNSEESDDSAGNISIQIEVDIEPPEESEDERLSDDQLERLGLPSSHVHYTAAAAGRADQHNTAELLQPADIQVSYAVSDTEASAPGGGHVSSSWSRDTDAVDVPQLQWEEDEVEPPLALPDTESLPDNIYHVNMFCGLQCGRGECRRLDTGVKKCLCPVGWSGDQCEDMVMISGVPRLSGYSHMTLPTLQNAYSNISPLQATVDVTPR